VTPTITGNIWRRVSRALLPGPKHVRWINQNATNSYRARYNVRRGPRSQLATAGILPHECGELVTQGRGIAPGEGVAVNGQSDRRVGVPEAARDRDDVGAARHEKRGVRAPRREWGSSAA
jgi:hypothetical protein